jgi:hypothetical protein
MPRAITVLLALGLVMARPTAGHGQTTTPDGYGLAKKADLYSGVEYVKLANPKGPVVAHVAHVLPGAPVDLQVVNANDRISASAQDLETTSSMCRRVHCIAGVNGDFHKFGVPAGAVIAGGRMLRSPDPDRPQLTVTKDGRLVAGAFPWTATVTSGNGHQLPVSTVNVAPPADGLAVFTAEYGPVTDESSRVELVVRAPGIGALNQRTYLELVSLRTGPGPIPAHGAVLAGDGSAGQQLREMWAKRQSSTAPARLQVSSPVDASVSLGVEPVVLRDGKRALPWRDPNVINPRQPHTLVGWNKEGHVYLIAVDGRQAASEGVNMAEAADFLQTLGVTDAVSLDGGGGTVFVADGSVWNRPSDNDPARPGQYMERGAPNAFVIMARPGAPTPSGASPGPAAKREPAPGQIRPFSAVPEPPDGAAHGSPTGPTASPENLAGSGDGGALPVDLPHGVGELADGELLVGPAAAGSAHGTRGRATLSIDGTDQPADPVDEGRTPAAQGDAEGERKRDGSDRAGADSPQVTLAMAGKPSDRDSSGDERTLANALRAALAAALAGGVVWGNRRPAKKSSETTDRFREVQPAVVLMLDPALLTSASYRPRPCFDPTGTASRPRAMA